MYDYVSENPYIHIFTHFAIGNSPDRMPSSTGIAGINFATGSLLKMHYKGSDNKNGTGYGNGTKVNLHFFYVVNCFAFTFSLEYDIYVYIGSVEI